ncbi:MAG: hypothetical protein RI897_3255 [Verrucomicrobiota bacterium]
MEAYAVTDDLGLDDEAFEDLDHGEDRYCEQGVQDIAEVDGGDEDGGAAGDD